jgi:UDP-N-acetylmuramate--alanine ligase
MLFRKSEKMHFIGIGGAGMSAIAEILISLGYKISGSDIQKSAVTERLTSLGVKIFIGHNPANIKDYDVVVTSSAIGNDNPELLEARKKRIPVIHRSEMLAELARMKQGIGVAGTHGKTTTSSMLSYVLYRGGMNPTAIIGGKVLNFDSNARTGDGDYIVFEADESDGTFLRLMPVIAVVTNIDTDHMDHYKSFDELKNAFLKYINNVPFYGYSVLCKDDKVISEMLPVIERPYVTYGFSESADIFAGNAEYYDSKTSFDCYYNKKKIGVIETSLLGAHNVQNALAVIGVSLELGIDFNTVKEALKEFRGVGRRIEKIGEQNGILVLDDYGHHPTEIKATLKAIRSMGRRIIVIFQPHRYSRTQLLANDFGSAFTDADYVILTEIYSAGEEPITGVTSELIRDSIEKQNGKKVNIIHELKDIPGAVLKIAEKGDVILTLGAGDIYKTGPMILDAVKK